MTERNARTEGEAPLRQEEESLPVLKVMIVALVAMIVFALAVLVTAWGMGHVQQSQWPGGPTGVNPGQVERLQTGIVKQDLFVLTKRAEQLNAEQLAQLQSYGWISRPHGIIHIPIDQAMQRVAGGARPAPDEPYRGGAQPGPASTPTGVTP